MTLLVRRKSPPLIFLLHQFAIQAANERWHLCHVVSATESISPEVVNLSSGLHFEVLHISPLLVRLSDGNRVLGELDTCFTEIALTTWLSKRVADLSSDRFPSH